MSDPQPREDYDPIDVRNIRHAIKEHYPSHPELLDRLDAILRAATVAAGVEAWDRARAALLAAAAPYTAACRAHGERSDEARALYPAWWAAYCAEMHARGDFICWLDDSRAARWEVGQ